MLYRIRLFIFIRAMLFYLIECDGFPEMRLRQIEYTQYYIHIFMSNCFPLAREWNKIFLLLFMFDYFLRCPFYVVVVLVGWSFCCCRECSRAVCECVDYHRITLHECTLPLPLPLSWWPDLVVVAYAAAASAVVNVRLFSFWLVVLWLLLLLFGLCTL